MRRRTSWLVQAAIAWALVAAASRAVAQYSVARLWNSALLACLVAASFALRRRNYVADLRH